MDHDCVVGSHCHIAPGAVISGGVVVEDEVHIGTGASVIQSLIIRKAAVVGAGSVIIKDLSKGETQYSPRKKA